MPAFPHLPEPGGGRKLGLEKNLAGLVWRADDDTDGAGGWPGHFHLEPVRSCSFGGKHPGLESQLGLLLPIILGCPLSLTEAVSLFRKGKLSL